MPDNFMTDQTEPPQPITGYRTLSNAEIALINEGKELAKQVGEFVDRIQDGDSPDYRWVAIAKTHLQQGFMALTRAIAQPTTF